MNRDRFCAEVCVLAVGNLEDDGRFTGLETAEVKLEVSFLARILKDF